MDTLWLTDNDPIFTSPFYFIHGLVCTIEKLFRCYAGIWNDSVYSKTHSTVIAIIFDTWDRCVVYIVFNHLAQFICIFFTAVIRWWQFRCRCKKSARRIKNKHIERHNWLWRPFLASLWFYEWKKKWYNQHVWKSIYDTSFF